MAAWSEYSEKQTTHNKTHMKIEKAIEMLQQEQKSGTKSIVFAYWKAELFGKEDDESWEAESEWIENDMDWSRAHDQMCDLLEATID